MRGELEKPSNDAFVLGIIHFCVTYAQMNVQAIVVGFVIFSNLETHLVSGILSVLIFFSPVT